ncbi:MAG: hypothetical protein QXP12_01835 [Ignisphaera sp.]
MGMQINFDKDTGIRSVAIVLLSFLALSMLPVSGTVLAGRNDSNASAYQVELVRAEVLRMMLTVVTNLNISEGLRISIDELLSVNISDLELDELREWVSNASRLLAGVEREVREGRAYAVGIALQRYLNGLAGAVEAKARRFNLTKEEIEGIVVSISRTGTAREEAVRILERVRERIQIYNVKRFAESIVRMGVESVEEDSIESIIRAQQMLEKATGILNATINRLETANISDNALEAISRAMENVRTAREILGNISSEIAGAATPIERERVREAVNKTLSNMVERVLNEVSDVREEIEVLIEECRNANATQLVGRLEALLRQLDDIASKVANISTVDLHTVVSEISRVKLEVKRIERELEISIEELPRHFIELDELFDKTVRELRSLVDDVNRAIERLSTIDTSRIVCIAIYPPPPACEIARKLPAILEEARRTTINVQQSIEKAIELYNMDRRSEALNLLLRIRTELHSLKFQLESIEKLLHEFITKTQIPLTATPVIPQPPVTPNKTAVQLSIARIYIRGRTLHMIMAIRNGGARDIEADRVVIRAGDLEIEKSVDIVVRAGSTVQVTISIEIDVSTAVKLLQYHQILIEIYREGNLIASAATNIGV